MNDAVRPSKAKAKWVHCSTCNGTGWISDIEGLASCTACGGSGLVFVKVKKDD